MTVSTPTRISGGLFASMLFPFSHSATLLFLPAVVTQHAGGDAWLSVLLGGTTGIATAWLAIWIARRHPGKGPVEIARETLGKWLGSLVGFVYMAYFLVLYSLVVRNVLDFVSIILLPGTPGRVIAMLLGLLTFYGGWAGLEPVARIGLQATIVIVLALLAIPVLLFREFSVLQVAPLLANGFLPVLKGAVPTVHWFMEALVVLTLVPHLNQRRSAYRWSLVGIGGGVVALTFLVGLSILVFGPTLTSRFIFPVYSLIQMISLAHFIERIEMLLILIWISGMFVKSTLCLFAAAESGQHLLGLKSHRWPAAVLAVTGVALTQVWARTLDIVRTGTSATELLPQVITISWILVMLLLGTLIRSLFGRKEQGHAQG